MTTSASLSFKSCNLYFGFRTMEDMRDATSRLQTCATTTKKTVFLDCYYDCDQDVLKKQCMWLRCRDGCWQLSFKHEHPSMTYSVHYINDPSSIIAFIKHHEVQHITWMNGDTDSLTLEKTFAQCLAILPTLRKSYILDAYTTVRIDTFKNHGKYWRIGSIMGISDEENNRWLKQLDIQEAIHSNVPSKFQMALQWAVHDKNTTTSQSFVCNVCIDDVLPIDQDTEVVESDYPYTQFDDACAIALEAQTPLELAFRHANMLHNNNYIV